MQSQWILKATFFIQRRRYNNRLTVLLLEPPSASEPGGGEGRDTVDLIRILVVVIHEGMRPQASAAHPDMSADPLQPERQAGVTVEDVRGVNICHCVSLDGSSNQRSVIGKEDVSYFCVPALTL